MNIVCEECHGEVCGCKVKDGKLDCPFCGAEILKGSEDGYGWSKDRCYGF